MGRYEKKKERHPLRWVIAAVVLVGAAALLIALFSKAFDTQRDAAEPSAPTSPYRAEAFSFEDGFLRYADGPYLVGMDVSEHQGWIDWQQVAQAGVQFVILRAGFRGSTEGGLYEDEHFEENYAQARQAGLQVGVYFFSQALSAQEAEEEAAYVCGLLEGKTLELPVYYDLEAENSERLPELSEIPMTQCAEAFCRRVEQAGYRGGVYFNQHYGYRYLDLQRLQNYDLWLAEYGDAPTFTNRFDCLQYTANGQVDGITGDVDLDLRFLPEETAPASTAQDEDASYTERIS